MEPKGVLEIAHRMIAALLAPPPQRICPRCQREVYTEVLSRVQRTLEGISLPPAIDAEVKAWMRVINRLSQSGWSYNVLQEEIEKEPVLAKYRQPARLISLLETEVSYAAAPYWADRLKKEVRGGNHP